MIDVSQCNQHFHQIVILGYGVISGTQFWLLEDWAFSNNCCQMSFNEWKSMLLSLCITFTTATVAIYEPTGGKKMIGVIEEEG